MSGIELAGVTLALLPLLVSAAENYGRCAAPISRFKNFPKEVEQFLEQVDIQKLVFRNQCRVLLENVVDQDVARTMIQTAEHHSWHDIELEARLAQLMENTRGSCIKTMESIDEKLKAIESECQKLSASLTESDQVGVVIKPTLALFRRPTDSETHSAKVGERRRNKDFEKKPYRDQVGLQLLQVAVEAQT